MHHNQRVSTLRPANLIQHGRGNRGRQKAVCTAVDRCDQRTILDDMHTLVSEGQHIRVINIELKRDKPDTIASRLNPGIG